MQAEIIAIGTEITSGAKLDTNSQWLSLQLADLGIPVIFHTTVADDLALNVAALQAAVNRADLVILTGGLGPTKDDLTREALAQLVGVELVLHAPSLTELENFFATRGRDMPERNRVQAYFPLGSEPLPNPIGTAPGIFMEVSRTAGDTDDPAMPTCTVACLPGVPSEMKKMFTEQVHPRLAGSHVVIRRARINCFGLGESAFEELLGDLTARGRNPEVGITAHDATITLRIIATSDSSADCERKISDTKQEIQQRIGQYVFGEEDDELQHVIVRELNRQQRQLATVESATRGLVAHWLNAVAHAEDCVLESRVLGKTPADQREWLLERMQTEHIDFGLQIGEEAITTLASGQLNSTIPISLMARTADGHCEVESIMLEWAGNPAITYSRAAKTALNMVWKRLTTE